jgi:hypothetical protein
MGSAPSTAGTPAGGRSLRRCEHDGAEEGRLVLEAMKVRLDPAPRATRGWWRRIRARGRGKRGVEDLLAELSAGLEGRLPRSCPRRGLARGARRRFRCDQRLLSVPAGRAGPRARRGAFGIGGGIVIAGRRRVVSKSSRRVVAGSRLRRVVGRLRRPGRSGAAERIPTAVVRPAAIGAKTMAAAARLSAAATVRHGPAIHIHIRVQKFTVGPGEYPS